MPRTAKEISDAEEMFLKLVVHRGRPALEAAKKAGFTGPAAIRPHVYAEALERAFKIAAENKILTLKWRQMFDKAKATLSEVMDDKEAPAAARVNACKAVLDTLTKIAPGVLKEEEREMTLDEAAAAVAAPGDEEGETLN